MNPRHHLIFILFVAAVFLVFWVFNAELFLP